MAVLLSYNCIMPLSSMSSRQLFLQRWRHRALVSAITERCQVLIRFAASLQRMDSEFHKQDWEGMRQRDASTKDHVCEFRNWMQTNCIGLTEMHYS
jgi:hypothetical protein